MDKNDKTLIYWIALGVLMCGFFMLFNLTLGRVMLNFLFLFYILVRVFYYRKKWNTPFTSVDKQRFALVVILSLLTLMNFMGISETYFLPIFIIMIEYLLIVNREKREQNSK